MTTLENSQMRQNMLLQYFEEIKEELQTVKEDLQQLKDSTSGSCSDCIKSITTDFSSLLDSKCQPNETMNEDAEKTLALNQDIAGRLEYIENLLKKREDADQDKLETQVEEIARQNFAFKVHELFESLKNMQDWIQQRSLPLGCETALLFPMRSPKIYASVHPAEMSLQAFTFCVWTKVTEILEKTIVISYGTKRNPYEIQLYYNEEGLVLVVGGDQNKINANRSFIPGEWTHICGTWKSEDGKATLWVNGEQKAVTNELAQGHIIPDKGIFQLGQEKNGCCVGGGFDESLAFTGKITGFNLWNYVLDPSAISKVAKVVGCQIRGNVIGWGTTEIQPHGGAQYIH